jgi:Tfp pilus assembly protein PilP
MKARMITLLWVVVAAAAVWAQSTPPSQKVASDAKAVAAKPAPSQAKPSAAPVKSAMASPMKPKPAASVAKPAVAKPAAVKTTAKPGGAVVKKAAIKTTSAGTPASSKRDPFLSPIREQGMKGPNCSTGKKCLSIDAMVLRGIVRSQAGMIAVVESSTRRISYFLRENDPVFNGFVVKITFDTIVFRENVMDRLGKQSTRDVVMKVVAPVV